MIVIAVVLMPNLNRPSAAPTITAAPSRVNTVNLVVNQPTVTDSATATDLPTQTLTEQPTATLTPVPPTPTDSLTPDVLASAAPYMTATKMQFLSEMTMIASTWTITPSLTDSTTSTPTSVPAQVTTETALTLPYVQVNVSSANLRSGPDTSYNTVGHAALGEQYPVMAQAYAASWYLISVSGDRSAWISASIVSIFPESAQIATAATIPAPPAAQATVAPAATGSYYATLTLNGGTPNEVRYDIACQWATGTLVRQNGNGEAIAYDIPNGVQLSGIFPDGSERCGGWSYNRALRACLASLSAVL